MTSAINGMIINIGSYKPYTYIPAGLIWGLNMLSRTAPLDTAMAYDGKNQKPRKVVVLMTDGENTGASATWNPALDDRTLATCTAARNAGVTIYTVAYMAPSNGISLLEKCAGSSSNAFQAENAAALTAAFAAIAVKISERATRITG